MIRNRILLIIFILAFAIVLLSCTDTKTQNNDNSGEELNIEEYIEVEGKASADHDNSVSPEFDTNGNPTGDYAQYLYEEAMKEEAYRSMIEDAINQMYDAPTIDEERGFPY